jgi:hypothetical protein
MPALVAGIHVFLYRKGVDAQHKAGHDGVGVTASFIGLYRHSIFVTS